jgi:DNA polymerase-3 subunit epsilon
MDSDKTTHSRLNFAAIDFETANYNSDSPCQVAVVIVEDGRFISEHSWLIRPREMYFSERCIAVHGILPKDVVNEPEWDEVWNELWPIIDGRVLLAHNAMFDMAVLNSTLATYDIACPRIDFQCTRLVARRCWPGRMGYGLKPTADMLGIAFKHHVAVEDARTCAEVALAAARDSASTSLEQLERNLYIHRGFVEGRKRVGPRTIKRPKSAKLALKTPVQALVEVCGDVRPFEGKHIFLHGQLLGMDRGPAIEFLERLGAIVDEQANEATDFWLMGTASEGEPNSRAMGSMGGGKEQLRVDAEPSHPLKVTRIISQRQFLALIPGGLEAVRKLVDAFAL